MKQTLCVCLFCLSLTLVPLHAKEQKYYLIASREIPYLIVASLQDETHVTMHLIPQKLQLDEQTLLSNSEEALANTEESIRALLQLPISGSIYLYMEEIEKEKNVPYTEDTFSSISSLCDYFHELSASIQLSDLFHYKDYLKSDLSLSEYYHLYKVFKQKDLKITYAYLNYIEMRDRCLPLDMEFHRK